MVSLLLSITFACGLIIAVVALVAWAAVLQSATPSSAATLDTASAYIAKYGLDTLIHPVSTAGPTTLNFANLSEANYSLGSGAALSATVGAGTVASQVTL